MTPYMLPLAAKGGFLMRTEDVLFAAIVSGFSVMETDNDYNYNNDNKYTFGLNNNCSN